MPCPCSVRRCQSSNGHTRAQFAGGSAESSQGRSMPPGKAGLICTYMFQAPPRGPALSFESRRGEACFAPTRSGIDPLPWATSLRHFERRWGHGTPCPYGVRWCQGSKGHAVLQCIRGPHDLRKGEACWLAGCCPMGGGHAAPLPATGTTARGAFSCGTCRGEACFAPTRTGTGPLPWATCMRHSKRG
jgi:hypothetical protein